jgi:hypothetical protein
MVSRNRVVSIERAVYFGLTLDASLIRRPLCLFIEKISVLDYEGKRPSTSLLSACDEHVT